MILLQAYWVNTLNIITYHMLNPTHPTETFSTAQSGRHIQMAPRPPKGSAVLSF